MKKYIRTTILVIILLLVFCIPCFAKVISSSDGRVSFVTSDYWYRTSIKDPVTLEIITIGYGPDTFISLKRSKYSVGFKSFRNCTYDQKSVMREDFVNSSIRNLTNQGFYVTLNESRIYNSTITANYTLAKDRKIYHATECYVVKDYYCYCLVQWFTENTLFDIGDVFFSLRVDGKKWSDWVEQ